MSAMVHDPTNPKNISNASQKKLQDAIKWSKSQRAWRNGGKGDSNGKGSERRDESAQDRQAYEEGWEAIFGKRETPHGRD